MKKIFFRFLTITSAAQLRFISFLTAIAFLLFTSWLSTSLRAETVQRWQDSSGQWHFGDHAAAKGHASKAVVITTPISIIKNDQSADLVKNEAKPLRRKTTKTRKKSGQASLQQNNHCDTLRQQVYDRPASTRKNKINRVSIERYEHDCIAGRYYGNS